MISFKNDSFKKEFEVADADFIELLSKKLILVSAGEARDSGAHAGITSTNLPSVEGKEIAREMASIARQTAELIASKLPANQKIEVLAKAMNESWELKQVLGSIHSEEVTRTIEAGLNAGAISAKLCGAGGSGFVLFILGDTSRELFARNFPGSKIQKISLHGSGSEIGPMAWN